MTREIKFRAWMPEEKSLVYNISVNSGKPIDDLDEFFSATAKDGLVWMQYTGLKDKNGKEIYEGDIVKCQRPDSVCLHVVEWQEPSPFGNMGQWNLSKMKGSYDWIGGEEMIGNIYENPELLT